MQFSPTFLTYRYVTQRRSFRGWAILEIIQFYLKKKKLNKNKNLWHPAQVFQYFFFSSNLYCSFTVAQGDRAMLARGQNWN